ncbi:MAG: hypothetical protein EXR05_01935 [Acetobacteraceae bacterium]|nr:hypothetical protein [Acetobacteraceae bacterium]MSP29704.1 hypothetical protein [Acetobacteraceae bacterium]
MIGEGTQRGERSLSGSQSLSGVQSLSGGDRIGSLRPRSVLGGADGGPGLVCDIVGFLCRFGIEVQHRSILDAARQGGIEDGDIDRGVVIRFE